jgi:hypothetical protein
MHSLASAAPEGERDCCNASGYGDPFHGGSPAECLENQLLPGRVRSRAVDWHQSIRRVPRFAPNLSGSILNGMGKRFVQHVDASYRPEGLIYQLHIPVGPIQALLKPKSALEITGQSAKAAGAELTKTSTPLCNDT